MRIILVRHGQTKWNSEGRVQGRTDIPLNARGMAQAEAVGEWLSGRKIDAVYASPLMRAHDTAKAIADRQGVCVKLLGEMIEIDFGLWALEPYRVKRAIFIAAGDQRMLRLFGYGGRYAVSYCDYGRALSAGKIQRVNGAV